MELIAKSLADNLAIKWGRLTSGNQSYYMDKAKSILSLIAAHYEAKVAEAVKNKLDEIELYFSATNYHSPEAGRGLVNSIDVKDWLRIKGEKQVK